MKRILYLSFYFEPDLSAGSFRNSTLVKELAKQGHDKGVEIHVLTTQPNRYSTFKLEGNSLEIKENLQINRISIPKHKNGFKDQIYSFYKFYRSVFKLVKKENYDLVFASSSRLFTAYLGYKIARSRGLPLYLDIRDLFTDTMNDVLKLPFFKTIIIKLLKFIESNVFNYASHINLISGGFNNYFIKYNCENITNYSNGIDEDFIQTPNKESVKKNFLSITYAGNIGEGQGLDSIIPQAAEILGEKYYFRIIGDGGLKMKLETEVERRKLLNVKIENPVRRNELVQIYNDSDFLFIHLNDYKAFEKVLPSKVFELGAYEKPILAGVSGFAKDFIQKNMENVILFKSSDARDLSEKLKNYNYKTFYREVFINKFRRVEINKEMTKSILFYI